MRNRNWRKPKQHELTDELIRQSIERETQIALNYSHLCGKYHEVVILTRSKASHLRMRRLNDRHVMGYTLLDIQHPVRPHVRAEDGEWFIRRVLLNPAEDEEYGLLSRGNKIGIGRSERWPTGRKGAA